MIGALLVLPEVARVPVERTGGLVADFRAGITYVRARAALGVIMIVFVAYSLLGSAMVQLAEPLARHVLATKSGYGLMVSGFGVGGLVGSVIGVGSGTASVARACCSSVSGRSCWARSRSAPRRR